MDKKKIFAIVLFLLMGFFMFTFANPGNGVEKLDNNKEEETKKEVIDPVVVLPTVEENVVVPQVAPLVAPAVQPEVIDTESPVIVVEPATITILEGTNVDVLEGVIATDNLDEEVEVIASITDLSILKPGKYVITYTATDNASNKTTNTREVIVLSKTGDEDNDGYSNEEEVKAGSDLNDENSTPDYDKNPSLNLENLPREIIVYDTLTREELLNQVVASREFYSDSIVLDLDMTNVDFYNVGTYEIYVSATDILGNKTEETVEFNVLRREVEITIDDKTSTYLDELETLTSNEEEVTYKNQPINVVLNTEATSKSEVGTYEINGTYENENYDVTFNVATYEIKARTLNKDEINLDTTKQEYTYDGTNKEVVVEDTDSYTVSTENNGRTNVGTQTVLVTLTGIGNYEGTVTYEVELKVNPKEVEVNWSNLTFTYDGTSKKPTATYENLEVEVTGEGVNAGTYTATASINENYKVTNEEVTFVINKQAITNELASIDNQEYTYDGTNKEVVVEDTDSYTVSTENNGRTNVGTQTVLVTLTGIGNYEGTVTYEVELKVNPKEVEVNWSNLTFTYDGTSKKPTATYENLEVEVTGEEVNAGTYTATASINENYTVTNEEVLFTINKAVPTYTVPTNLEAEETDTLNDVVLPNGFAFEENLNTELSEGTYTTTVSFTPEDEDNYEVVTGIEVSITVNPKYFTVKFYDYNNEELKSEQVRYHESATAPTTGFQTELTLENGTVLSNPSWDKDYSDITSNLDVYLTYEQVASAKTTVYLLNDGEELPNPIYAPNDSSKYTTFATNITIKDDQEGNLAKTVIAANKSSNGEAYIAVGENVYNYLTNDSKNTLKNLEANADYTVTYYVLKYVASSGWHLDGYRVYKTPSIKVEQITEKKPGPGNNYKNRIKITTNKEIASIIITYAEFNPRANKTQDKTVTHKPGPAEKDKGEYVYDLPANTKTVKITLKNGTYEIYKLVNGIFVKED